MSISNDTIDLTRKKSPMRARNVTAHLQDSIRPGVLWSVTLAHAPPVTDQQESQQAPHATAAAPARPNTPGGREQLPLTAQLPYNAAVAPPTGDRPLCAPPFHSVDSAMASNGDLLDFEVFDIATKDSTAVPDLDLSAQLGDPEATNQIFSQDFDQIMSMPYDFIYPLPQIDLGMPDARKSNIQPGRQLDVGSGLSRFGSRLPSLEPISGRTSSDSHIQHNQTEQPMSGTADDMPSPDLKLTFAAHPKLQVTNKCRERILSEMVAFAAVLPPQLVLPTKHALGRFMAAYTMGYYDHNPVIHLPTLDLEQVALELFLALASIGARYCREERKSDELFQAAKVVIFERLKSNDSSYTETHDGGHLSLPTESHVTVGDRRLTDQARIQVTQALITLVGASTWFSTKISARARDTATLRTLLGVVISEFSTKPLVGQPGTEWEHWIKQETLKRIQLHSFCLSNIQTIAYNTTPTLIWSSVDLPLPCSERRWRARDEAGWKQAGDHGDGVEPTLKEMLHRLFQDGEDTSFCFTSLGGYVLIHAILQHIWLLYQSARIRPGPPILQPSDCKMIGEALRRWCIGWEQDKESSMDPISPNGPLAFTSTALLRLAYIQISVSAKLTPVLSVWNSTEIARLLSYAPPLQRNDSVTRAVLHCAHALSIPAKLGIEFVAHNMSFFWSNQHALCALESAMLLSRWLEAVTVMNPQPPLTNGEVQLLQFVKEVVAETEHGCAVDSVSGTNVRLNSVVVRVWSKIFRAGSVWEFVDLVGDSLEEYADLLEGQ
ncbi:uncharacterized protein Z520_10054 [Fonsecaea multimorphosa CBS 102226]|uniref:Xylanolytic transcriptional activator regulatory domain-containing protein n=1 Tax=Fonsecaea multimorphosa CBS 102226 TaxID=1442371 RepID=A0A0D2JUY6_9EURO|nr:uncharacterized protein Z520_10054 [Fonsecaea multimorphosa CBS 102226]KIX94344.1 hypothetical protein Z520_10054 [Fonsecaea multimorphosa CBS 102226]